MPTSAEWQQALCKPYRINIESSSQLCDAVINCQQNSAGTRRPVVTKPNLTPWPAGGMQRTVEIRPIDVLHQLGRITTPLIPELVDLSSTWAEIRYLWAFQPNFRQSRVTSLRLSNSVKNLDFHQKTLLSDEFGVGFAAYYMSAFEGATDPVDVFIAKRSLQSTIRGNSRRSLPDYIFRGRGIDQYFIVECKGTQSQRSAAVRQLKRGAEQVMTIMIAPPASVTRLVIGSWLQNTISILVIDPDDLPKVRLLSRWSTKELDVCARAKKLAYIGDYAAAQAELQDVIEDLPSMQFEKRELVQRPTDHGSFLGSEELRRTPDGRELLMFRGIRQEAGNTHHQKTQIEQMQTNDKIPYPFLSESFSERDTAIVRSISPDGSLFEVRVR
jgi:hypothetical protein